MPRRQLLAAALIFLACCKGETPVPKTTSVETKDASGSCGDSVLERRVIDALREARRQDPHSRKVGEIMMDLAAVCRNEGKLKRAAELVEGGLMIWQATLGPQHPDVAKALVVLAEAQRDQGDYPHAINTYNEAFKASVAAFGKNHKNNLASLMGLGDIYYRLAALDKAEDRYRQALAIEEQLVAQSKNTNRLDLAMMQRNLALVLKRQKRFTEAASLTRQALVICSGELGVDDPARQSLARELDALEQLAGQP